MARPLSTLLAVITAILLVVHAGAAPGRCAGLGEYQVKAAFLYNFSKYVEWPLESSPSGSDPIVITVLGTPSNGSAFESITGKIVKTRRIEVRNAKRLEEVGQTQIIFVCASEKEHLGRILDYARNEGVLTVSDMEHFEQAGGIISFITVDQKVRFQINLGAARRSGLKISSQLLKLARNVID